ncbi:MAG TPA: shikimate dehydrogenase [Balneolales bacterium]|nr:shikimate dehydrogenase [Balneolales bacterium]
MKIDQFLATEFVQSPFCVLFGYPVGHSLSPLMHNTAANYHGVELTYNALAVPHNEIIKIGHILNHKNFLGANITIPYKTEIIEFIDDMDEMARAIGAVNTIYRSDERLLGTNTDVYGFCLPIKEYEDDLANGDAIVFGTGGASRAIVYGLGELGLQNIYMVSRNPDDKNIGSYASKAEIHMISYDAWTYYAEDAVIIVNASPVGMEPNTGQSPVNDHEVQFLADKLGYDIVYKPMETKFIRQLKSVNGTGITGLDMLIYQGSRSFEIWTGKTFPIEQIRNLLVKHLYEKD